MHSRVFKIVLSISWLLCLFNAVIAQDAGSYEKRYKQQLLINDNLNKQIIELKSNTRLYEDAATIAELRNKNLKIDFDVTQSKLLSLEADYSSLSGKYGDMTLKNKKLQARVGKWRTINFVVGLGVGAGVTYGIIYYTLKNR